MSVWPRWALAAGYFQCAEQPERLNRGGAIETRGAQIFIRLDGAFDELQKIRDTPLFAQGKTLKLSDVATVERGYEDPPLCRFVTSMNRRLLGVSCA
jgi:multidrug efflux pump subunit AcrB